MRLSSFCRRCVTYIPKLDSTDGRIIYLDSKFLIFLTNQQSLQYCLSLSLDATGARWYCIAKEAWDDYSRGQSETLLILSTSDSGVTSTLRTYYSYNYSSRYTTQDRRSRQMRCKSCSLKLSSWNYRVSFEDSERATKKSSILLQN